MKKKTIKALMGFALTAVMFTTSLTGVYAETAEEPATEVFEAELYAEEEAPAGDVAVESEPAAETNEQTTTNEEPTVDAGASVEEAADDATNESGVYIVLGENLKEKEKAEVLKLLGVDLDELVGYTLLTVSNEEEHHYLDEYVDKDKIGTRALSSVVVKEANPGDGLNFTINNIDYCTVGMYQNVCTTVGIKDADITIAGPFKLSGTAALIGIIKAYEAMTGETVSADVADAAMHELVVTGELESSIDGDSKEIEAFMADLKGQMKGLKTDQDIIEAIKETAKKYNLSLSETDIDNIHFLLSKLQGLDLDWDFIAQQADDLAGLWNEGNMDGFWGKLKEFLLGLLKSLKGLFS